MGQKTNTFWRVAVLAVSMIAIGANGFAQSISSSLGVVPYPAKGQSPTLQNRDEGASYAWAKQQTGIDPIAVANKSPPAARQAGGRLVRGAAKGAAGGAAIGAIAGDTGEGAAIGATVGTMAGIRQARQDKKAQANQAQDAKTATTGKFNKAFGACLEGKGYTVKF